MENLEGGREVKGEEGDFSSATFKNGSVGSKLLLFSFFLFTIPETRWQVFFLSVGFFSKQK